MVFNTWRFGRREDFRVALRVNLTSSHEEEEVFDRLFADFGGVKTDKEQARSSRVIPSARTPSSNIKKPSGSPLQYGREEILRTKDLCAEWPGESAEMGAIIKDLARRLATRPSRRLVAGHKGRRIDLRRSCVAISSMELIFWNCLVLDAKFVRPELRCFVMSAARWMVIPHSCCG